MDRNTDRYISYRFVTMKEFIVKLPAVFANSTERFIVTPVRCLHVVLDAFYFAIRRKMGMAVTRSVVRLAHNVAMTTSSTEAHEESKNFVIHNVHAFDASLCLYKSGGITSFVRRQHHSSRMDSALKGKLKARGY